MWRKYYLIIVIMGALILGGCVEQQVIPLSAEEKVTNQCIDKLNVFEDIFGISGNDIKVLNSECTTCSPWYNLQVATFSATIEKDGKRYSLFFSDNCPRRGDTLLNYKVNSEENTVVYNQIKSKICTDFSDRTFLHECFNDARNVPSISEFASCVNNRSKFIEEDWKYCSTEGWKRCNEWNSCGPSGPTQTSVCTKEYCQMSCLLVYSEEKIQKRFIEVCKNEDKIENGKHVFTFEVPEDPKDIEETISSNFLK